MKLIESTNNEPVKTETVQEKAADVMYACQSVRAGKITMDDLRGECIDLLMLLAIALGDDYWGETL